MKDKEYSNLGSQIKDMVADAIGNMDYEQLNKNIGRTVGQALEEVRRNLTPIVAFTPFGKNRAKEGAQIPEERNLPMTLEPISNKKSILRIGFGLLGGGCFSVLSMGSFLWGGLLGGLLGASADAAFVTSGISLLFAAGFFGLSFDGFQIKKKRRKLDKYLALMDGKAYADLKTLAIEAKESPQRVAKDFQMFIKKGVFLQGRLNSEKNYFLGNYDLYKRYMISMEQKVNREQIEQKKKEWEESLDEKVKEAVKKGKLFISQIRDANLRLPAEVISKKLDRLELVTNKIFDRVIEKPGQISQIRRFMDYYLPTTQKLVEAYENFENQPLVTENIKKSKAEIENTLDTINSAFEALYENLMEEDIMDISSDISVLNTMLVQEGLKRDGLQDKTK